jgi:hypothetical protein
LAGEAEAFEVVTACLWRLLKRVDGNARLKEGCEDGWKGRVEEEAAGGERCEREGLVAAPGGALSSFNCA